MIARATAAAIGVALAATVTGCSNTGRPRSNGPGPIPTSCGLPTPSAAADASKVPRELLLDGEVEVSGTQKVRGGYVSTINTPYGVQEALPLYRQAVKEAGFRVLSEDNEGFEAELYLRDRKTLAALQIRRSICEDASLVFVSIVSEKSLTRPQQLVTPGTSPRG